MRKLVAWKGGTPLLVDDSGSGSGLICLHGIGGGSYFFTGLSQSLIESRRIVSFDMPDTGFNVNTVDRFSIEAAVEATVELIDLVSPEPSVLLGHSMGTIVALKAYAERPDAVAGLVFLGGLPEPVSSIKEKLTTRISRIEQVGMNGIGEEAMPGIFAEGTLRERRQLVGMFQRLLELNAEDSYVQSIEALISASAVENAQNVQVPCLAITGTEDLYAAPPDVQSFADSIPGEVDVQFFENCGHMVFYEDPGRFNESVNTFLQSLDSDWAFTYGDDS